MNNLWIGVSIIALGVWALPVHAEPITVIGATVTCPEWNKSKEEIRLATEKRKTERYTYVPTVHSEIQWLMGFMSALALTQPDIPGDLLRGINGSLLSDWMDRYCRKNLQKDTADGVLELTEELKRTRKAGSIQKHDDEGKQVPRPSPKPAAKGN